MLTLIWTFIADLKNKQVLKHETDLLQLGKVVYQKTAS
jgi:hypothetical protein